ncbi:MAG: hypothetical protein HKO57_03185, partial [Akkermansiaceae bacterium]|nr:hypothetical protein [Akkermansiaceae bacterium]
MPRSSLHLPAALLLAGACLLAGPARAKFVNFETPQVHPVAMSPDGSWLAICNTADHRLEIFAVEAGTLAPRASIPVGYDPVSVRFRTNSEAWVVNQISDSISVVNVAAQVVRATLGTKDEPADVIFAGTPEKAYVTCSQANCVQVFDPAGLAVPPLEIAIAGEDPRALAVSGDGSTVFAAIYESGNGSTVLAGGLDSGGGTLAFPPNIVSDPSGPYGGDNPPPNAPPGFDPPLNPALATPPQVGLIVKKDAAGAWRDDNGTDWTPWVSGANAAASGRPVGWDLLDHDVAIIDTATNGVTYAGGLMNICMAIAVHPATGEVVVVGTDATNEIRFEPKINGTFLRVNFASFAPSSPGAVTVGDLNPHLDYSSPTVAQTERDRSLGDPRAVAWNAAGSLAFVTGMGSNNLAVFDAAGNRAAPTDVVEVGEGPTGLAIDELNRRIYVLNRFEASVSIVDLDGLTELTRLPFFDPTPAEVKTGRRHLYDTHETSGLGHTSCASCHVDARMDRLAWDLGDPSGEALTIVEATTGGRDPGPGEVVINKGGNFPLLDSGFDAEFHPMKGPMTTQTLQDIIGKEPHHWRGDRQGIEQFGGAFTALLGDDETLTTTPAGGEMQEFEDYLDTIHFPPNPYRNIDNTLPTSLPLPGHFATGKFALAEGTPLPPGNPRRALTEVYRPVSRQIDGVACITCHALPIGIGTDSLESGGNPFFNPQFTAIPPGSLGERHHALVGIDGSTQDAIKVPQ